MKRLGTADQIENLRRHGLLPGASRKFCKLLRLVADVLMRGFHGEETSRVLAEERLHCGVLQRREEVLADNVVEEAAWTQVDYRWHCPGVFFNNGHLKR